MTTIDGTIELIKLISLMVFISSIGAQVWIAFLDITKYFTEGLERFRPKPAQDKYSRIAIIIGILVILIN